MGPVLDGERYGFEQESKRLLNQFGSANECLDADESLYVDGKPTPSKRIFGSDFELLWGNWATEVSELWYYAKKHIAGRKVLRGAGRIFEFVQRGFHVRP